MFISCFWSHELRRASVCLKVVTAGCALFHLPPELMAPLIALATVARTPDLKDIHRIPRGAEKDRQRECTRTSREH